MQHVVVDGVDTPLGARVAALIEGDVAARRVATGGTDVVLLAAGSGAETDGSTLGGVDVDAAIALLDRVGDQLRHVTVVSSAMAYGAWPDNPVPLTEDAPLRPNPGSEFAIDKAELERRVQARVAERAGVSISVLRPALTVWSDPDAVQWMERSIWHAASALHGDRDPARQFLHLDDLASAIDHCRRLRLDGVFNVAPKGWVPASRQIELAGGSTSLRIPEFAAEPIAAARWRFQLASTPPEVLPYAMESWVVSSGRLMATGWRPEYDNEEAFVTGHRESWWSSLSARRRQDISLGATVAALVGVVGASAVSIGRLMRNSGR